MIQVCLLQKRIIPFITSLIEVGVFRGNFSRGMRGVNRYQPYPQNMQYGGMVFADYGMYLRGYPRQRFGSARSRKHYELLLAVPQTIQYKRGSGEFCWQVTVLS